jgi:hypothetical protein
VAITRGATCDTGMVIMGGIATVAAGVNANQSIKTTAISAKTCKAMAIPSAIAAACECWLLAINWPMMLSKK